MRTITPTERALIGSGRYAVHVVVEVMNSDGVWVDLTALGTATTGPINWLEGGRIAASIDDPVMSGDLRLRRDATANGATVSLAPFLAASGLNRDAADAYAPLLNAGRQLRWRAACVAPGASAATITAAMRGMLVGKLDALDWSAPTIATRFRDLGAYLLDATLEDPIPLGAADGSVSAGMVIQAMLDAVDPPPSGIPTVYEPTPILFAVTRYRQEPGALLEAARNVALQAGGDLRYRFDAADVFRLTFTRPDRDKTSADFTLPPSEYLSVRAMSVDDIGVRNKIQGIYKDSVTKAFQTLTYQHATSYAEFGPRFMRLVEPASSLIDTPEEETRFLTDIAKDLAFPKATHTVESLFLPFVELGDVVAFPDNGVHYDAPQTLAVVGVEHTFENGSARTTLSCRGTPAGAYREWLEREGGGVRVYPPPPAPTVGPAYAEASSFGGTPGHGGVWLPYQFDAATSRLRFFAEESDTYPAPLPDVHDENTLAKTVTRLPGERESADTWASLAYFATTPGKAKTIVLVPDDGAGREGRRVTFYAKAVDPAGLAEPGSVAALSVERRPAANVLTITLGTDVALAQATYLVVRRNTTIVDYVALTTEAGAAADVAQGAVLTWNDPGLEAPDSFDYEVFLWSLGLSGPARAYGVAPQTDPPPTTTPPATTPPTTTPPPASDVAAPAFGLHSGTQTPYYGDAVDGDGAGWVRVVWDRPAPTAAHPVVAGVALEKTYRSDGTGWFEVTYSTLAHYDNRVAGAYESGSYRLVAKDPAFNYLSVSAPVFYLAPGDTTTRSSGGGGGRTTFTQ